MREVEGTDVDFTVIDVSQRGRRVVLAYPSFDIEPAQGVEFLQQSSRAQVLNRVLNEAPTRIDGYLLGNGQVLVVNPAGVWFGPTAVVDVGALYAVAGEIAEEAFRQGEIQISGLRREVVNQGQLRARGAGPSPGDPDGVPPLIVLAGGRVQSTGSLEAPQGAIVLAAGPKTVRIFERASNVSVSLEGSLSPGPVAEPETADGVPTDSSTELAIGDLYSVVIAPDGRSAAPAEVESGEPAAGSIDLRQASATDGQIVLDADAELLIGTVSAPNGSVFAKGDSIAQDSDHVGILSRDLSLRARSGIGIKGGRLRLSSQYIDIENAERGGVWILSASSEEVFVDRLGLAPGGSLGIDHGSRFIRTASGGYSLDTRDPEHTGAIEFRSEVFVRGARDASVDLLSGGVLRLARDVRSEWGDVRIEGDIHLLGSQITLGAAIEDPQQSGARLDLSGNLTHARAGSVLTLSGPIIDLRPRTLTRNPDAPLRPWVIDASGDLRIDSGRAGHGTLGFKIGSESLTPLEIVAGGSIDLGPTTLAYSDLSIQADRIALGDALSTGALRLSAGRSLHLYEQRASLLVGESLEIEFGDLGLQGRAPDLYTSSGLALVGGVRTEVNRESPSDFIDYFLDFSREPDGGAGPPEDAQSEPIPELEGEPADAPPTVSDSPLALLECQESGRGLDLTRVSFPEAFSAVDLCLDSVEARDARRTYEELSLRMDPLRRELQEVAGRCESEGRRSELAACVAMAGAGESLTARDLRSLARFVVQVESLALEDSERSQIVARVLRRLVPRTMRVSELLRAVELLRAPAARQP